MTRQTSAFNFSTAVTTQGASASSQGNSITPVWGTLTSLRKNYTFGQAEKSALERVSQSVAHASSLRSFRGKLSKPSSFPFLVTGKLWGRQDRWGALTLWQISQLGVDKILFFVCPVCWSHYHLKPECTNCMCSGKNLEVYSFRSVLVSVSQSWSPGAHMCRQRPQMCPRKAMMDLERHPSDVHDTLGATYHSRKSTLSATPLNPL